MPDLTLFKSSMILLLSFSNLSLDAFILTIYSPLSLANCISFYLMSLIANSLFGFLSAPSFYLRKYFSYSNNCYSILLTSSIICYSFTLTFSLSIANLSSSFLRSLSKALNYFLSKSYIIINISHLFVFVITFKFLLISSFSIYALNSFSFLCSKSLNNSIMSYSS
jgi:hypothetical protein